MKIKIPSEQERQQLAAFVKKFDEAKNNNDAVAMAALFTENAVIVTDPGPITGREAIEKYHGRGVQAISFQRRSAQARSVFPSQYRHGWQ